MDRRRSQFRERTVAIPRIDTIPGHGSEEELVPTATPELSFRTTLLLITAICSLAVPGFYAWGDENEDESLAERLKAVEEQLRNQPKWPDGLDVGGAP